MVLNMGPNPSLRVGWISQL